MNASTVVKWMEGLTYPQIIQMIIEHKFGILHGFLSTKKLNRYLIIIHVHVDNIHV